MTSYPNKIIVPSFIRDFIEYVSKYFFCNMYNSINPQFIDNMLILFSSIWLTIQDARSYLLVYAMKFQECKESLNMKSFGLKIGQHLPELIDIFSSLLVSFMAEVLKYLFQIFHRFYDYIKCEELKLSIIKGFIEAGNTDSCFIAVKILSWKTEWLTEYIVKYNQLIEKFQEMQEPAITTTIFLYNHNFIQFWKLLIKWSKELNMANELYICIFRDNILLLMHCYCIIILNTFIYVKFCARKFFFLNRAVVNFHWNIHFLFQRYTLKIFQ